MNDESRRMNRLMGLSVVAVCVVGLGVVSGCRGGPARKSGVPPEASTAPTGMPGGSLSDNMVGAWELVSVELRDAAGGLLPPPVAPAFGSAGATGLLICDASRLGLAIMQQNRPSYARPTPDEAMADLDGYTALFGIYAANETDGLLSIQVQGSRDPRLTETEQIWAATAEEDRLTVELAGDGSGTRRAPVWRRLPDLAELTPTHRRVSGFWKHIPNDGGTGDEPPLRPGFIIYTAAGRMMVHLMSPGRETHPAEGPTPEQAQAAVSSYTSYFGPYTVDESGDYLVHHRVAHTLDLTDQPPAERRTGVGTAAQRFYEFVDDKLVLRFLSTAGVMPPPAFGAAAEWGGMITWERLTPPTDVQGGQSQGAHAYEAAGARRTARPLAGPDDSHRRAGHDL